MLQQLKEEEKRDISLGLNAKRNRNETDIKVTEKITLLKKIQVSSIHITDDSINEINVLSMVTKHKVHTTQQ